MTDQPSASALHRAVTVGVDAASYGFDWERPEDALDKVAEEVAELRQALQDGLEAPIAEELGDLLFAVCNVARMVGQDPEDVLTGAVAKFEHRFSYVLETVAASGRNPRDLSLEQLEELWQQSKTSDVSRTLPP